jgi:hypothetical protein
MFHNNFSPKASAPQHDLTPNPPNHAGLSLVPPAPKSPARPQSSLLDLLIIASRRCSSFFAEAAVLVLVFGILDFCILRGRIELVWILGALAISVGLLAASILTDFTAHRWIKAHP